MKRLIKNYFVIHKTHTDNGIMRIKEVSTLYYAIAVKSQTLMLLIKTPIIYSLKDQIFLFSAAN